jgi:hypothetical protein
MMDVNYCLLAKRPNSQNEIGEETIGKKQGGKVI